MATTNQQNRSGNQKGSAGGQQAKQKASSQQTQGDAAGSQQKTRPSDRSSQAQMMADMKDEAAHYVSKGVEKFGSVTRGHEGQATLIALAAGFGVGLVIGCSLVSSHHRPETWRDRVMAEGIGRKFLDRVEGMIPEAIADRFGR
jgi:hypothetical protein